MSMKMFSIAASLLMILSGMGVSLADQSAGRISQAYEPGDDLILQNGVIGVIIQVAADRIGDPAALYVLKVRQDGPAQQAGLRLGDEIIAVNGTPVKGKSYEEVVSLIRGEPETSVKLEVRGTREFSIKRVAGDKLRTEGQSSSPDGQSEKRRP
jgi:C-terminal processing protease CtpA/Prc